MDNESEKNKLSIDEFIAFVDSFFILWEDKDDFRSHLIIYMGILKQIKGFADNDNLHGHIQAKFRVLHTLLRDIELLPVSTADDPAYKDQLIGAKKLWQDIKP